jgi:hypothetical protein
VTTNAVRRLPPPTPGSLPTPPVSGLTTLRLAPSSSATPARSEWFLLPSGTRIGFFLSGTPQSSDTLDIQWGKSRQTGVKALAAAHVSTDFGTDAEPTRVAWRFYGGSALPTRPEGANAVRFVLRTRSGTALGLTGPVGYSEGTLAAIINRSQPALALPNLLPYVPCVRQPVVGGTTEVPGAIVAFRDSIWPLAEPASPFLELSNLYPLIRLPLFDSSPRGRVAAYQVDRQIPGGAITRAVITSS